MDLSSAHVSEEVIHLSAWKDRPTFTLSAARELVARRSCAITLDGGQPSRDMPGFGFFWNDCYWASLTLDEPSTGGRRDAYFGPVGADPHHHSWLKWADAQLTEVGARLKDPSYAVRPPAQLTTSFSTQTLARFRAVWDPDRRCVTTEIADVFSGSAYTAAPSESARTQSGRNITHVDVSVPDDTRIIEGELAYCYIPPGAQLQELSTDVAYLPVSSNNSLGIAMRITRRSTG